jgi:hypothetical protein
MNNIFWNVNSQQAVNEVSKCKYEHSRGVSYQHLHTVLSISGITKSYVHLWLHHNWSVKRLQNSVHAVITQLLKATPVFLNQEH